VAVRNGGGEAEGPGTDGVAPTASLNGMRRSEKAKVLEKDKPDIQGLRSPRTSEQTFIHIHAQVHTHHAQHHAASAGVTTAV
jgi:hypothetical protein